MKEKITFENSSYMEVVSNAITFEAIQDNLDFWDLSELLKAYTSYYEPITEDIVEKYAASLFSVKNIFQFKVERHELIRISETILYYLTKSFEFSSNRDESELSEMLELTINQGFDVKQAFDQVKYE